MSLLNDDLTLNIDQTINHAESLIENGCHGTIIFGSTGQAQLLPIAEKINLLNKLSTTKYKHKYIVGTGLNSLGETINLMNFPSTPRWPDCCSLISHQRKTYAQTKC